MTRRTLFILLGSAFGAAGATAACGEPKTDQGPRSAAPSEAPPQPAETPAQATADAGSRNGPKEPSLFDGPLIGGLYGQTPIMSDMEWPKEAEKRGEKNGSMRIGYIRQGAKVPVIPQAHPKPNCKDGWYELVQGGFVCGRYATLDLNHPKIKNAPHLPDYSGNLPFQYGYNATHGTPLYKTVPSREERLKFEPWLAPKPKPKPKPREDEETAAYGDDLDAGVPLVLTKATIPTTDDPFGLGADALDAGVPWYMREYTDGGKPQVTLEDLKGEGPLARRMVKGFFVALDKEMTAGGARWWKTTNNLLAPYDRIYVHDKASKFRGIWFDEAQEEKVSADGGTPVVRKPTPDIAKPGSKSQVGIVMGYKPMKYIVSLNRKQATAGDPIAWHTVVKLTGDQVIINGREYDETDEGYWLRASDITKTKPGDPPKDLAPGEKWIDVNIKTQTLVAFEGDRPVFATAVSTGKEDKEDPEKDHKTPTGTWRIREKHVAATMDGDVASDGPYSIEDVPWIMYFNGSYALHGAFWHNQFGRTKSHGCVNLSPADAKALFNWTEPKMPEGWHGVWSTAERPGTRVVVHE